MPNRETSIDSSPSAEQAEGLQDVGKLPRYPLEVPRKIWSECILSKGELRSRHSKQLCPGPKAGWKGREGTPSRANGGSEQRWEGLLQELMGTK